MANRNPLAGASERMKANLIKEGTATEDDFLCITINNAERSYVLRAWLETGGRGAGSTLAHMLLGTEEGFEATSNITLEPKQADLFDALLVWLWQGDGVLLASAVYRQRSRDLFKLATYFGFEKLVSMIQQLHWPTEVQGEVISINNRGVICKFFPWKHFGFILDKNSREEIWFSEHAVYSSKAATEEVEIGQECLFDVHIRRIERKPNSKSARNIRTLSGEPFKKEDEFVTE